MCKQIVTHIHLINVKRWVRKREVWSASTFGLEFFSLTLSFFSSRWFKLTFLQPCRRRRRRRVSRSCKYDKYLLFFSRKMERIYDSWPWLDLMFNVVPASERWYFSWNLDAMDMASETSLALSLLRWWEIQFSLNEAYRSLSSLGQALCWA